METKKYYAQDMPAALEQIKSELGPEAIIVKSRKIRQRGGLFGLFGKPVYEVVVSFDPEAVEQYEAEQRKKTQPTIEERAEMERIAPKRTHEETVKEIERLRSIAQNPTKRVVTKPPREERLVVAQEKAQKLGVLLPGQQKETSEEQEFQNEMLSMLLSDDAPRADSSNVSRLGAYGAASAGKPQKPAVSEAKSTPVAAPAAAPVQSAAKNDMRWADNIQDAANEARPRAARAGITTAAAYAAMAGKKPLVSAYVSGDEPISDDELQKSDEKFREHERLVKEQLEKFQSRADEDDDFDEDEGVIDAPARNRQSDDDAYGGAQEASAKRKRGRPRKYPVSAEGGDTRWASDIDARMRALESMIKQMPDKDVRGSVSRAGADSRSAVPLEDELNDIRTRLEELDVAPEIALDIAKSAQRMADEEHIDTVDAAEAVLRDIVGKPRQVRKRSGGPRTVMLIGPTGVGKTTTLVKLVSSCVFDRRSSVAIINADVYRVGAQEQLSAYAKILDVPLITIYGAEELKRTLKEHEDKDFIFIDTCGKASVDKEYQRDMQRLIEAGGIQDVYVVVSSTSSYKTYKLIADSYSFLPRYNCILTKLDESSAYGAAINMRYYNKNVSLSYMTTGQNVPDDIIRADADELIARLLG